MKISKEGQNLRKLIKFVELELQLEEQNLRISQQETRASALSIPFLRRKLMELRACLDDPPAKAGAEVPQPKRRTHKKQAAPVNGNGDGVIYKCSKCGESFTRPAVDGFEQRCPHCNSTEFEPVAKES